MKTNNLRFTDHRTAKDGTQWDIVIKLNDECHNGHQDFSITGNWYEAGKLKTENNCGGGGACGDEIAKEFPEYAIFNNLHLCDYLGIPLYCVQNGYYFLTHGFDNYETGETLKSKFCKEYRITESQFDKLSVAKSTTHFAVLLEANDIFSQWKKEADKAIKQLEKLTGNEFIADSTKNHYDKPSASQIEEEKIRIIGGCNL